VVYGKAIYHIVSFGKGYGKTALIEALTKRLRLMGYKVAVIKHAHRGIDVKDKDSYRIIEAGANTVIAISESLQAMFKRGTLNLIEDIISSLNVKEPLILIEGFKNYRGYPKIVLVRNKSELMEAKSSFGKECFLIVNVGKEHLENSECKVYTFSDIGEILEKILSNAREKIAEKDLPGINCKFCGYPTCIDFAEAVLRGEKSILNCPVVSEIELKVNGIKIPLSPYPKLVIYEVLKGLLKSLKGVPKEIESLELRISYGKGEK